MSVKLVVYDLDGTLIDSAPATVMLLNQLRSSLGLTALLKEEFIPWLSLGGLGLISKSLNLSTEEDSKFYLNEFRRRAVTLHGSSTPLYKNVMLALSFLKGHDIKLAICTNKASKLTNKVIQDLRVDHFFDVVVAGDEVPNPKPHPAHLLACINRLNIPIKDVIFVGDSTVDQQTAIASNVEFAFYQKGYDDGVVNVNLTFEDHLELAERIIKI